MSQKVLCFPYVTIQQDGNQESTYPNSPVGDERLSAGEIDLLHTPALQRLYDLHQLGLTNRIYIDASHSRLHHVVGVLEQTEKLVAAIMQNLLANPDRVFFTAAGKFRAGDFYGEVNKAKPVIRLIKLLHDITHAPYGHTIEDEIHLVACKRDEPIRQSDAFYRLVCQYLGWLALEAGVRPARIDTTPAEHRTHKCLWGFGGIWRHPRHRRPLNLMKSLRWRARS